ncbi:hypothetical protein Tcan_08058 [Toxocara canis]|uniref:Uncharacterized protein n=1 Tax=Toxocara canis TaxID=6265 RepID=A0A0B2V8D6_TOXCA|nr:hypothetical protein Tcan_08058 [Toxocara canis]
MDRDARLRAFIEEYARAAAMFDDVAWMRQSLERMELLIAIMVAQMGAAILMTVLFFMCKFLCCDGCSSALYGSGSSNVVKRDASQTRSPSKSEEIP